MNKLTQKRLDAVKRMNRVNAGLLFAAHELERATQVERDAHAALVAAEYKFYVAWHTHRGVT